MRWQGGRRGGNIEDRRGMGGGIAAGGLGLGGVVIVGLIYLFTGQDVSGVLQTVEQGQGSSQQGQVGSPEDQAGAFVDVIGANIDDVWRTKIEGYQPPTVVLYEGGTGTACGTGQAAMGPFYCPADQQVYLDLSFWQELETSLGASGAEFARAYVIAHEYGHHVQTLTGTSQQVQRAQQQARGQAEANRYSVALELQADCYAGMWARNASAVSNGQVAVEAGDLEEGMRTAAAIGDDNLQRRSGRAVQPDGFTHGSSAQRVAALRRGYEAGDPSACGIDSMV
ncbi:MAG: neutral zinc metallopeptidase [Brevundimonas sp.]|uniref:KPN_02809 family neutral zinc metallopeptidase n=1 Tax=Brevundimonas sp. TaxID=1871086 RepID=UPI001A30C3DA|nr:neutral zinc metallopeptidase [Brevundimonas sp.]MBJ7446363.1 neutral zinc metallopeptidase [Brevundimonas sp.]